MPKFLKASEARLNEMERALETIMRTLSDTLTSKRITNKKIAYLHELLELFFFSIFDVNFQRTWRIDLLTEMLAVLLTAPLKNSVPKSRTLMLYGKLDIINTVTFLIFQTRQLSFSRNRITGFLEYIRGDKDYNYYAILFYRVNPVLIKNIFSLNICDASPKELYFGITTGYFPYREGTSESYSRLVKLINDYSDDKKKACADEPKSDYTPMSVLTLLKQDGFISSNTYDLLTDNSKCG